MIRKRAHSQDSETWPTGTACQICCPPGHFVRRPDKRGAVSTYSGMAARMASDAVGTTSCAICTASNRRTAMLFHEMDALIIEE